MINIDLLSRITYIKSKAASTLVYNFTLLPSPSPTILKQIQKLFNDYIWRGGRHYLKATAFYQPYSEGWLAAPCVSVQEASLKLSGIPQLLNSQNAGIFWVKQFKKCLKIPLEDLFTINMKFEHMSQFVYKHCLHPF